MNTLATTQVFLASPSDVAAERDALVQVVDEINRTLAVPSGIYLDLVRWETHVRPGMAEDAQAVVNGQIQPRDLFVGIMWARFGTPTSRAESGTEEEFERAYCLWKSNHRPHIMLYFKTKPFFPKNSVEIHQLGKVLEFRERVQSLGALTWEFGDLDQFKNFTRQHLTMHVRELAQERASSAKGGQEPGTTARLMVTQDATNLDRLGYDTSHGVAIRPTLVIVYRPDGWYLQNKGRGTALDIIVAQKHVTGAVKGVWFNPVRLPALGATEEVRLTWLGHENDTGLGAAYRDEDGRPFTALTGNDLTRVIREWGLPAFEEEEIRRHWQVPGFTP